MKKLITTIAIFIFSTQFVFAATVHTPYFFSMYQYNIEDLEYVLVTAEADGEITSEHGLNLILDEDPDSYILWNDNDITVEITNGGATETEVVSPVFPEDDYKILHIDLDEDIVSGGTVKVKNIQVRTYSRTLGTRYMEVDLDGDYVADVQDGNGYNIGTDERNNIDPPYPVTDVEYTINSDNSITISWSDPPDYDFERVTIDKYSTTDGVDSYPIEIQSTSWYEYTDTSAHNGDSITYNIYARDTSSNPAEPVTLTFDLEDGVPVISGAEEEEEQVEEQVEEPIEEQVEEPIEEEEEEQVEETEEEELARLLNYYKIRYSIKCMPSGVAAAENDSACLWARIDLIYAQDILDSSDIDTSLSDFDIHLMTIRRQYSESRYQENCVDASESASYCPALGKALNRVSYFLD